VNSWKNTTTGGGIVGYGTGWNDVDDPMNNLSHASNRWNGILIIS